MHLYKTIIASAARAASYFIAMPEKPTINLMFNFIKKPGSSSGWNATSQPA
jgi:hypothetical protein